MKKSFIISLLLLSALQASSQNFILITFEDSSKFQHISVDTIGYPGNKWQIGKPSKVLFDSSLSLTKAILTDTLNVLPASDTSVFEVWQARPFPFGSGSFVIANLEFNYKMHKDSLDLAKVEIMADTSGHWVNMLTEDTTFDFTYWGMKPDFQDTTDSWKQFRCNYSQWFSAGYSSGFYPYYADADTFRFRFTLITSGGSLNEEGWMIDNINIVYGIPENTENVNAARSPIFYPNPLTQATLHFARPTNLSGAKEQITIYTALGAVCFHQELKGQTTIPLNLEPGLYFIRYHLGDQVTSQTLHVAK